MSTQRGTAFGDPRRCEFCGVELRKRPGTAGRPARFCSGTCRQRARRRRVAAEKVGVGRAVVDQAWTVEESASRRDPALRPGPARGGPAYADTGYGTIGNGNFHYADTGYRGAGFADIDHGNACRQIADEDAVRGLLPHPAPAHGDAAPTDGWPDTARREVTPRRDNPGAAGEGGPTWPVPVMTDRSARPGPSAERHLDNGPVNEKASDRRAAGTPPTRTTAGDSAARERHAEGVSGPDSVVTRITHGAPSGGTPVAGPTSGPATNVPTDVTSGRADDGSPAGGAPGSGAAASGRGGSSPSAGEASGRELRAVPAAAVAMSGYGLSTIPGAGAPGRGASGHAAGGAPAGGAPGRAVSGPPGNGAPARAASGPSGGAAAGRGPSGVPGGAVSGHLGSAASGGMPGEGAPPMPATIGLPAPLDAFVGREDDIAELKALLSAARLVTLIGPGGAGKTRLALELAARVGANHPDGIWLVELAGLTDGRLVAHHVADSLGVLAGRAVEACHEGQDRHPAEWRGEPVEAALVDRLRGGRMLLILDNCEHLVDESARLAVTLLRACPGLTVLTTSRQPLDAPGEHLYPVHGLSLPPAQTPRTRGELLRSDAVRLFVERAKAVSPAFEFTKENGDEIAEVCVRLDGNPLAIELAARLARQRPIGHILERLDDRLHLLSQGTRTAEDRHRDLRAAIDWSYELLDPAEQRLFRHLSVLAGWFTVDGVLKACADPGLTADDALHLLGRLEAGSLLMTEPGRPGGRFRLMESIRLYAQERLVAAGEDGDAYERLVDWLLAMAAPVVGDERLPCSGRDLAPLLAEFETLGNAVDWAIRRGDDRRALLALSFAHCLRHRGRLDDARRILDKALAGTGPASPGRASAVAYSALLAAYVGSGDEAVRLAEEALDLARTADRPIVLARALLAVQAVRRCTGDLAAAEQAMDECLSLLDATDSPAIRAAVRHERVRLAIRAKDPHQATALLDQCLAAHRDLPADEAGPTPREWAHTAATIALLEGEDADADRRWREELAAYRSHGDDPLPPLALEMVAGLAVVAARGGDDLRAVRLAAAAGVLDDGPLLRSGAIPADIVTEAVTSARASLPATAATAAVRDGERLDAAGLVAYALDGTWTEPSDFAAAEPVLTDRERQVALLVAEGLANRQIARRLHVSERTVHTHLERIRTKLGLPSRTHIVRWVVEEADTVINP